MLTLHAAFVYMCVAGLLRAFGAKKLRLVALIPPLLFLAIYSKYRHCSAPVAAFTAGVACVWAWLRFGANRPRWRLGSALLIEACLYAAAPSALVVFVPVAALAGLVGTRSTASLKSSSVKWDAVERVPTTRDGFSAFWKLLLWLGLSSAIPLFEGAALFGFAPAEACAKLLPLAWDRLAWRMTAAWIVASGGGSGAALNCESGLRRERRSC